MLKFKCGDTVVIEDIDRFIRGYNIIDRMKKTQIIMQNGDRYLKRKGMLRRVRKNGSLSKGVILRKCAAADTECLTCGRCPLGEFPAWPECCKEVE